MIALRFASMFKEDFNVGAVQDMFSIKMEKRAKVNCVKFVLIVYALSKSTSFHSTSSSL